jgi:hypothetical protein
MSFFRHACTQEKTLSEKRTNPAQRRITVCGVLSGISSTLGGLKFHCWRTTSQNERPPSGNDRKLCLGLLSLVTSETRLRANMLIPHRKYRSQLQPGSILRASSQIHGVEDADLARVEEFERPTSGLVRGQSKDLIFVPASSVGTSKYRYTALPAAHIKPAVEPKEDR